MDTRAPTSTPRYIPSAAILSPLANTRHCPKRSSLHCAGACSARFSVCGPWLGSAVLDTREREREIERERTWCWLPERVRDRPETTAHSEDNTHGTSTSSNKLETNKADRCSSRAARSRHQLLLLAKCTATVAGYHAISPREREREREKAIPVHPPILSKSITTARPS